jgi:carbonic anhydrase/acetyltransferase-like protein (isoleucine patch superfamily)
MVHGCILADRAFVGLGAIVMDGCAIDSGGMLAAGAMLTPGKRIGSGELWGGRPAKLMRMLSEAEQAGNALGVAHYVENGRAHRAALSG